LEALLSAQNVRIRRVISIGEGRPDALEAILGPRFATNRPRSAICSAYRTTTTRSVIPYRAQTDNARR